jgi:uncharacterized protein YcbK (DUF882 family)
MSNQRAIQSYEDFAKRFTLEYDGAIRRGYQIVNKVSVMKPNTEMMENMMNLALLIALQKQSGLHDIINQFGVAIEGYWLGATLNNFPVPIIPSTGAFQNIQTTSAVVTKPGEFPDMREQFPTDNIESFLDLLVVAMQIHLFTIEGVYNTISMYPGFPSVPPAPGILQWVGYEVPNTPPSAPAPVVVEPIEEVPVQDLLQTIPDDNNTVEAVQIVAQETGRNIVDDDGEDAGPQIAAIKAAIPEDVPEFNEQLVATEQPTDVVDTPSEEILCGDTLDYELQLSPNYKVRSLSIDAVFPHKIKNQVGLTTEEIVCNLKTLAVNILEPLRANYPNIRINSAFRGTPSLPGNRVSQHEKGEAVDIQIPGFTPQQYLVVAKWVVENTAFDQIIYEHGNSIWLHISTKRNASNRKVALTMYRGNYESGIKTYYT